MWCSGRRPRGGACFLVEDVAGGEVVVVVDDEVTVVELVVLGAAGVVFFAVAVRLWAEAADVCPAVAPPETGCVLTADEAGATGAGVGLLAASSLVLVCDPLPPQAASPMPHAVRTASRAVRRPSPATRRCSQRPRRVSR
jgi:hypothetical protein